MSFDDHHLTCRVSSSFSHTPQDDRLIWERLHTLLSHGYHALIQIPDYGLEVNELADVLRAKLFLSADPYFLDLMWELFSLFPSSVCTTRLTIEKINYLDPTIREANRLDARIFDESSQLSILKREHEKVSQLSIQLDSDIDTAANIRDVFLEQLEHEDSPELRNRLAQAQRLVDHLFSLFEDTIHEEDDLAEIIQTRIHRLADLEVRRGELQHDSLFHAHLLADLCTLETDLKILVTKIGAYFRFI